MLHPPRLSLTAFAAVLIGLPGAAQPVATPQPPEPATAPSSARPPMPTTRALPPPGPYQAPLWQTVPTSTSPTREPIWTPNPAPSGAGLLWSPSSRGQGDAPLWRQPDP